MTTIMNTISAASYVSSIEEGDKLQQQKPLQRELSELTPNQPLPGSAVSLNELWRLIEDSMKAVANAVSCTGKENSEAKKSMIELQKESQIEQLKDREKQIEKQRKAKAKQSFWGKLTMALGFIAAIVIAPFNPVMSAIMIGTMVASIVVPKIADKIMKDAGVSDNIRSKVTMGLEIGIGLVGMLASFNPVQLVKNIAKMAADAAVKAAEVAVRTLVALRNIVTNLNLAKLATMLGKAAVNAASKAAKLLDAAIDALKAFKTTAVNATKAALSKAANAVIQIVEDALNAIRQMKALLLKALDGAWESIKSAGSALKVQLASLAKWADKATSSLMDFLKNLSPVNVMSKMIDQVSDFLNTIKSIRPSHLINKAKQLLDDVIQAIKDAKNLMTNSEKAALRAARIGQVTEVSSNVTTVANMSYGIQVSEISKDLEISQAKHDALVTQIEQILMMLSQAMRAVSHSFESLQKANGDFREFNQKMISIHM